MIYTLTRDDIPSLSAWIKNSRSEEREFFESFELNGTNENALKTESLVNYFNLIKLAD